MARLHYNLVRTALDGAINSTDTTVTLTTALKEGGPAGTDIPTVASPDVLAVRIDDEILHVTAYTSGALTATVTRHEDDTVAAGHIDGSAVKHVIAKDDLGASGGGSAPVTASRTTGDRAVSSTAFVDLDTALDLILSGAATGDMILVGINGVADVAGGAMVCVDAVTRVAGNTADGNYISGGMTDGVSGWRIQSGALTPFGGPIPYIVAAGDFDSGDVRLRFRTRVSASSATIYADGSNRKLTVWAKNLSR